MCARHDFEYGSFVLEALPVREAVGSKIVLYLRLYERSAGESIWDGCFEVDPVDPTPPFVQWWTQDTLDNLPAEVESL